MPLSPALKSYDRDNGQAGIYAPSHDSAWNYSVASALGASRCYLSRFAPSRPMTIKHILFFVHTAAGANDNCDVGIYTAGGSLLGSSGTTAGKLNSTGLKSLALASPVSLSAGVTYYAAHTVGTFGGSAATVVMAIFDDNPAAQMFGNAAGQWEVDAVSGTGVPLPPSLTLASEGNNKAVFMALSEN